MTQPVLECVNPWVDECTCGASHMPCWPRPDTSCCDELEPTNPTPEQAATIERMLHVATEIIWRLSGRQFGACPVSVRPCRKSCSGGNTGYWSDIGWMPVLDGGVWFNTKCDRCKPSGCSCAELCEVDLPGPVASVSEVKLDGEVLPPAFYRVDNFRKLVRIADYGPDSGPTALGSVITGNGTWCDVSPAPDAANDFDPVSGGCYEPQVTNPWFFWNSTGTAEATYAATSAENTTVAFYNGAYPTGDTYNFGPSGTVLGAGDTLLSDLNPDGTLMRITVLSGQATRCCTPYSFDVMPGTRLRMERIGVVQGGGCWPTCQNMTAPTTEEGTFEVTYLRGEPVPQGGLWAAGQLACQLIKACSSEAGECVLPKNAQRIARQGVTVELTPLLIRPGGFNTGIPEVDLWLNSVNPYQAAGPSRVYSVDRPAPRTTTWPC